MFHPSERIVFIFRLFQLLDVIHESFRMWMHLSEFLPFEPNLQKWASANSLRSAHHFRHAALKMVIICQNPLEQNRIE